MEIVEKSHDTGCRRLPESLQERGFSCSLGAAASQPELSRRLSAAIAELGYRPNFAAKVLTTRSTGLIGVVVNELENPNTVTLLNELSRELGKSGYSITLCLCESREVQEGCKLISRISNGMVDAIINMLPQLTNEEVLAAAADTPVLTYRRHKRSPIIVDYGRGVMQALDYLTGLGHRRIGLISVVKLCCGDADPRETAYREYMIRKGLLDPALIFPGAGRQCQRVRRNSLSGHPPGTADRHLRRERPDRLRRVPVGARSLPAAAGRAQRDRIRQQSAGRSALSASHQRGHFRPADRRAHRASAALHDREGTAGSSPRRNSSRTRRPRFLQHARHEKCRPDGTIKPEKNNEQKQIHLNRTSCQ